MIHVTDTHSFVFFVTGNRKRLGAASRRAFEQAARGKGTICLPSVALFEIAQLVERGRLKSSMPWDAWVALARRSAFLQIEPLTLEDVLRAASLSFLVDPFDRFIVGTALRLGAPLITADERITESGVVDVVH
jgi:PIN domain nuclease of toxin-antitoxin system